MLSLIKSTFAARRVRTLLTTLAIALSVSLVVAVTSGYASVESAALAYLNRYLGSADGEISRPQTLTDGTVPQRIINELFKDPDIRRVTGRLEVYSDLFDKNGKPIDKSTFHVIGIGRPQDTRIDSLAMQSGKWFDTSDGDDAVVDQVAAEALHVTVGDTFALAETGPSTSTGPAAPTRLRLKVVGIIHKPEILAAALKSIYVPISTLQNFEQLGGPDAQVNQIAIDLKGGADANAFADRWNQRLKDFDDPAQVAAGHPLKLRMVSQDRAAMDLNLRGVRLLSYLGGAISMLAATFIIFSALTMGVSERQRTLAMFRAIGATRAQVARLVISEGLILSAAGVIIGIPLGIFWTQCLQFIFSDVLSAGVSISRDGMAMAAAGAIGAAIAASLLPAWTASRLSPLEAMAPLADNKPHRAPVGWAVLGAILIGVDPAIMYLPWESLVARFSSSASPDAVTTLLRLYAHFSIGVECLYVGFFLIAPLIVWTIEKVCAYPAAFVLRVPATLLRQQLSSGIWRAAGAGAALMVGLAVLVAMTTQGMSMLEGWRLPDKFPDIFLVSLKLGGLSPDQWTKLGQTPGIRRFADGTPQFCPVAVTVSGLGNNPLALVGAVLAPTINSTLFFGVPPKAAFDLMHLDFRDNDGRPVPRDQQDAYEQRAEQQLEQGRHVIITEDYRRRTHAKYGDKIALYNGSTRYDYTICGIVWPPGLDVLVTVFDLGKQADQRTAGMVFGSLADAQRDFGADNINLFAANLDMGLDKEVLLKLIAHRLGELNIKAGDVRTIKSEIDSDFRRLLLLLTTVAFSAMAVASMGVTNTIMASIRSRRWQLGVLRSVGLCAGQLLRLVLAEAFLLGAVGLVLGLGCGTILAIDARILGADMLGYLPPLIIPWTYITIGCGAIMVVAIAAALWPAIHVSRTEPLMLLQAGRASS
ncbi:MAG: FtsX-like permease family protein [Tepidisphaeraceae bacterium]